MSESRMNNLLKYSQTIDLSDYTELYRLFMPHFPVILIVRQFITNRRDAHRNNELFLRFLCEKYLIGNYACMNYGK